MKIEKESKEKLTRVKTYMRQRLAEKASALTQGGWGTRAEFFLEKIQRYT